ncbi:MAG: sigma-70 family RNA polymerase sigma factor [Candidatus Acidiferrum sp.]
MPGTQNTSSAEIQEREKTLISRVLAGETELFHELIRPYEHMVYSTVFAMVKNEADAEDGAQDTMISAYRNLGTFRGEAKFSTWLVTIAMNEGRKHLRRAKSARVESLDEQREDHEGDFTPVALTDWREIPSVALEKRELREKVRAAVQDLPQIYREVVVLRDLEELNQEETAAALDIPITLVKVRLHRGRILMQKKLVPYLRTAELPRTKGSLGRFVQ